MICWLYAPHADAPASVGAGVANENGQCGRANSRTCHPLRRATTAIPARQCAACESPSTATGWPDRTPTEHARISPCDVHATLGVIAASSGVGVTDRAKRWFTQGFAVSRDAAP